MFNITAFFLCFYCVGCTDKYAVKSIHKTVGTHILHSTYWISRYPHSGPYFFEVARTVRKVEQAWSGHYNLKDNYKHTKDRMCIGTPADVFPCQLVNLRNNKQHHFCFRPELFLKQTLWKQWNSLFITTVLQIEISFVSRWKTAVHMYKRLFHFQWRICIFHF